MVLLFYGFKCTIPASSCWGHATARNREKEIKYCSTFRLVCIRQQLSMKYCTEKITGTNMCLMSVIGKTSVTKDSGLRQSRRLCFKAVVFCSSNCPLLQNRLHLQDGHIFKTNVS